LRGRFDVLTEDGVTGAGKGNIISIRAGVSHEAHALRDSTILITASMR
jgi:hypothetical protein